MKFLNLFGKLCYYGFGRIPNLIMARRLRRWPNIQPTLVQRLVFAGSAQTQYEQAALLNGCTQLSPGRSQR